MQPFDQIAFALNYAAFIIVLWLGLYLVLHNPRYPIAWLTAFTLWSMAVLFLHYLLEDIPENFISINSYGHLFTFGLVVAPALAFSGLAFWHHATMLMRPKRMNLWSWTTVIAAYVFAAAAVAAQASYLIWVTPANCPPLLNCRLPGVLFPIFAAALVLFFAASVINLIRSARATPAPMPRRQLIILAYATVVAGLTVPAMMFGMVVHLPVPMLVISLILAVTVGMLGYGVARFSALMEGRTIRRDFLFNLGMICLITAIYFLICWNLAKNLKPSPLAILLIPILAVFTHTLVTPVYRLINRLSLRRETRQMHSDLQRLSRLAFEGDTLLENIRHALEVICRSVRATCGVVLVFENSASRSIAEYHIQADSTRLPPDSIRADDVTHLAQGTLPGPLEEAALLIPLYQENAQFGALLLGRPVNGLRFADEDVERILNPAEMIGEAILFNKLREKQISQATQLSRTQPSGIEGWIPIDVMENVLRNLYDYAYLADSPLAELALVQSRLPGKVATHLDRGKVIYEVTLDALNKLNPGTAITQDPPPREWYPYLVLKYAYLEGVSNRDIMMRLYISEGTFNRTRRSAVRSVARAMGEMETNLRSV